MSKENNPAPTRLSEGAAVLDVDYTLVPRVSVERLFVGYLWDHGRLGFSEMLRMIRGLLTDGHGPMSVRIKTTKAYLAGQSAATMERLARVFVADRVLPAIAPKALTVLESHRRRGHRLLLLTGCPEFLVRPIAEELEIDSLIGTRLEEKHGLWTGRLIPPHPYGEAKRRLLQVWAEDRGIHLASSHAYADSRADRAILEEVGHPHVVNPTHRMRRLAAVRGWPILEW